MNALVEQTAFGVTTSSRTVAEVFNKQHLHVLRDIDVLVKRRPDLCPSKFGLTSVDVPMPKGGVRQVRAYEMNRYGFTLLAMGFDGEEALEFKISYLDAFDRMEAELARLGAAEAQLSVSNDNGDDLSAISVLPPPARVMLPPVAEHNRCLTHVAMTARLFGIDAGRWMWEAVGLPMPPPDRIAALPDGRARALDTGCDVPPGVAEWVRACTVPKEGHRELSTTLYRDYQDWCAEAQRPAETQTVFGRSLERLGHGKIKSGGGNIWRVGLKLLT